MGGDWTSFRKTVLWKRLLSQPPELLQVDQRHGNHSFGGGGPRSWPQQAARVVVFLRRYARRRIVARSGLHVEACDLSVLGELQFDTIAVPTLSALDAHSLLATEMPSRAPASQRSPQRQPLLPWEVVVAGVDVAGQLLSHFDNRKHAAHVNHAELPLAHEHWDTVLRHRHLHLAHVVFLAHGHIGGKELADPLVEITGFQRGGFNGLSLLGQSFASHIEVNPPAFKLLIAWLTIPFCSSVTFSDESKLIHFLYTSRDCPDASRPEAAPGLACPTWPQARCIPCIDPLKSAAMH